jgi:hypothetical protein
MLITNAVFTAAPGIANVTLDNGDVYTIDTSLPADEQFRCMLADWRAAGGQIAPYVPAPPALDDYRRAIQAHLDATAQQRGYDSIHTAVGYRDDPNPAYAAEAEALFTWRSAVWTFTFAEMAKVQTGQRLQPTVSDLIGELPAIIWPG